MVTQLWYRCSFHFFDFLRPTELEADADRDLDRFLQLVPLDRDIMDRVVMSDGTDGDGTDGDGTADDVGESWPVFDLAFDDVDGGGDRVVLRDSVLGIKATTFFPVDDDVSANGLIVEVGSINAKGDANELVSAVAEGDEMTDEDDDAADDFLLNAFGLLLVTLVLFFFTCNLLFLLSPRSLPTLSKLITPLISVSFLSFLDAFVFFASGPNRHLKSDDGTFAGLSEPVDPPPVTLGPDPLKEGKIN